MHYFGFNMASPLMSYASNVRYALSLAVDRDYAADTLMQGGAVASRAADLTHAARSTTSSVAVTAEL